MAADLYKNQAVNVRKTWILMSVFFLLIIAIGWFLSYAYNNVLILYFAAFFSIFMNIFSYWNSHKIVLRIAGAKRAKREEYFDLYNMVENLAITAGLPNPKVYVIEDNVPNAFATGRNAENGVVAVSTGLLKILDKAELEGVIAHELAHIGNRDILLQTVVVTLVGLITLLADWFWRISFHGGDRDSKGSAIILIIGIILMILSPIFANMIQLAISRKREYLADSTGSLLTRYPEGLASALEKISGYSGKMKNANHATAHLYISNPYGKKKRSKIANLFSTHPPTEERITRLRGMKI